MLRTIMLHSGNLRKGMVKRHNRNPTPHLHVEITHAQNEELNRLLPWGTKTRVFQRLVDDLIKVISGPQGQYALGAILRGDINIVEKYELRNSSNNNIGGRPPEGDEHLRP